MKPTGTDLNTDAERWSLSWQPEGRCNAFSKEAILTSAPATSGVYGLFNFDCQVLIGAAPNIQEALLHHLSETDFQSQHLQPTGFTFEACSVEMSKSRADELIARFRPVLQAGAALTGNGSSSKDPIAGQPGPSVEDRTISADDMEFPSHEREKPAEARRRFRFERPRITVLAGILVAAAVIVIYLGMPADYSIQQRASGANPTSAQTEDGSRPPKAPSVDVVSAPANQPTQVASAKPDLHVASSTPNPDLRDAAKSSPAAAQAGVLAKTAPVVQSVERTVSKKWSVQVSAAPTKDVADTMVQRLKANGHDGYVVQAEVKGQNYYRVRVGHFNTQEEAESVRQALARQEDHRDAYITRD